MADQGDQGITEPSTAPDAKESRTEKTKRRGVLSRIWNGLFRMHGDDFEKRLQHISKEEATVLARLKKRSQSWRSFVKNYVLLSLIIEVIALVYAIVMTRQLDLDWKMRAFRVLPMFFWPVAAFLFYFTLNYFRKMLYETVKRESLKQAHLARKPQKLFRFKTVKRESLKQAHLSRKPQNYLESNNIIFPHKISSYLTSKLVQL